jgi:hypothetical protein
MDPRSSSPMSLTFAPLESVGAGRRPTPRPSADRAAARRAPRSSAARHRAPRPSLPRPSLDAHDATPSPRHSPATPRAIVAGALVWLLLGCSGLMWVIAFTSDIDSLVLALAVWVLAFVGPSLCATSLAYRLDAGDPADADDRPERA